MIGLQAIAVRMSDPFGDVRNDRRARLVNMFHFSVARLGLSSLWIDFVNSESNPADIPSRAHEMRDAEAQLAPFGRRVEMVVPEFATDHGTWMSMVDIARSVWG